MGPPRLSVACRRLGHDADPVALAAQAADARSLVDQRAASRTHRAKPARQARRVNGPGVGHQGTGPEDRGSAPLSHFGRAQLAELVRDAEPAGSLGGRSPTAVMERRGADGQHAAMPDISVYRVALTPGRDIGDRSGDFPSTGQGALVVKQLAEQAKLVPPAVDEAAVAAGGASTADVHLQNH